MNRPNTGMDNFMLDRSGDRQRAFKPNSKEVNSPIDDGTRRPFVVGTFNSRISQGVQCHDRNLCRPKWLNKLLNRLLNNAD